jgi:signal transduction histidine kinase
LSPKFSCYEDKEQTLSLTDYIAKNQELNHIQKERTSFQFGISGSTFFCRLDLSQVALPELGSVISTTNVLIDYIDFAIQDNQGKLRFFELGDRREIKDDLGGLFFGVPIYRDKDKFVYIQVDSENYFYDNFDLIAYSDAKYLSTKKYRILLYTFLLGGLIFLFVYNTIVTVSLWDKDYIFYTSHLFFFILWVSSFTGYNELISDNPFFRNQFTIFSAICTFLFITLFFRSYLNSFTSKRDTNIVFGFQISMIVLAILCLLDFYWFVIVMILIYVFPILIFLTYYLIKSSLRGDENSLMILICFGFPISGMFIHFLKLANLLPSTTLTQNAVIIGASLADILFAYALTRKINNAEREKEEAKNQKIRAELALDELSASRAELSRLEREGSVNQLAAHLAHEINNPLNFISTGITVVEDSSKDTFELIDSVMDDSEDAKGFKSKISKEKTSTEVGLAQIRKGLDRIMATISEIRAITKVDGLQIQNLDLVPLIYNNAFLTASKSHVDEKNITFLFQDKDLFTREPAEEVFVLSNQFILARSIRSLVSSSIHFAKKSKNPKVEIQLNELNINNDKLYLIYISNNGPPIEAGKEKDIFDLKNKQSKGVELIGIPTVKELLKSIQSNLILHDNGRKSGKVSFMISVGDIKSKELL